MKWTTNTIRKTFLDFFESKDHLVVSSDPIVIKDDPTLMFTNAGMNQFKGIFIGNEAASNLRVCDSQKCLRVSGKHNDLEEVGRDHYHHTMFEMLGNWSFGDYFKEQAIDWSWELLTEVYGLDKSRLYVSIFSGDKKLNLEEDAEARSYWSKYVSNERILAFGRKDNFWEMGDTGPCGPCSEIHYDMRPDVERDSVDGGSLVNQDHPEVIEIWNLVFMQFNHLENGTLTPLKAKHIDTGMGLERLARILQDKKSNYDIDVFQSLIAKIEGKTKKSYSGADSMQDIAFRVLADHVRAVSFAIADGQLPSNTGAGYVIRRVLRRAIRYGYSYLAMHTPFIHSICEQLISDMGTHYPELEKNKELIVKVVQEEERSFLTTLSKGLDRLDLYISDRTSNTIEGEFAFELYDTYGFPIDLTALIAEERQLEVDMAGFHEELSKQKDRSRSASKVEMGDWTIVSEKENSKFVGYDKLEVDTVVSKFREVKHKGKNVYQLVLETTPFYAESGGQVGDRGALIFGEERMVVIDCKKENGEIVHFLPEMPKNVELPVKALVDSALRFNTARNHTATHLLHQSLRERLGKHVEQKGSFVSEDKLRFDFSHFEKISDEQLGEIEKEVNGFIRSDIRFEESREMDREEALNLGAMALFGEKYGNRVRVVKFGDSIELCGGTHVESTGRIGGFKLISESSIASGVRRVEAISGEAYDNYVNERLDLLDKIEAKLGSASSPDQLVDKLITKNKELNEALDRYHAKEIKEIRSTLQNELDALGSTKVLVKELNPVDPKSLKEMVHAMVIGRDDVAICLGSIFNDKPALVVGLSENLVKDRNANASKVIRSIAQEINGGGGGQEFLATAGGKNKEGLRRALEKSYTELTAFYAAT